MEDWDREKELRAYRGEAWAMGTLIPGMSVRLQPYGDFQEMRVTYQLAATHSFSVERKSENKAKITNNQMSRHQHRTVRIENVAGTIVQWAASRDSEQAQRQAKLKEERAKEIAERQALHDLYGLEIQLVEQLTNNQRTNRYREYQLNPGTGNRRDGVFEVSLEEDGRYRLELNIFLPTTVERKEQMQPSIRLIGMIGALLAEARMAYVAKAEATPAVSGKVVSIHA